ncbi:MAG: transaldolase [Phycisphaeraceae bacterium]|nr:transaldolase [Phycisphaeraceae bacterium]
MSSALQSLIASGTKLWLDSIDPDLIASSREAGATGATSNPIIVSDLLASGRYDERIAGLIREGRTNDEIAWDMTDHLVRMAQDAFDDVWSRTSGDDGYVSFELDPLLEDAELAPDHAERVRRYVELGRKWAEGHRNRMIKVPATAAGLDALEELAAAGVILNVTLIFTPRQYELARENVWRGAQRRPGGLDGFKSVYSIFVSRVDVYTEKHVPELSDAIQGQVGIVNVKQLWASNRAFWQDKGLKLAQEIIFASTGTKKPEDPADKYVAALAGADIQTNPPGTNDKIAALGRTYTRRIDELPDASVLAEIDRLVDLAKLEDVLMKEGVAKFADPQKKLLELIDQKRAVMAA